VEVIEDSVDSHNADKLIIHNQVCDKLTRGRKNSALMWICESRALRAALQHALTNR
jgi:hypothetical protein